MVIYPHSIVSSCDTYEQGSHLRAVIEVALLQSDVVEVDFSEFNNATTSFVNAAFVELLHTISFEDFKRRVKITRAHRQIANLIKDRLVFESKRIPQAA